MAAYLRVLAQLLHGAGSRLRRAGVEIQPGQRHLGMEDPIVAGVLGYQRAQVLPSPVDFAQAPAAQPQKQLGPRQQVARLVARCGHGRQQRRRHLEAFLLVGPVTQSVGRRRRQLGSQGLHPIEA